MSLSVGCVLLLLAAPPASASPSSAAPVAATDPGSPRIVARWPDPREPGPRAMRDPPARPAQSQAGLQLPGDYFHLSPGIGGVVPIPHFAAGAYAWGLGAGHHFTRGRNFAADVGGSLEHLVVVVLPGEDGGRTTLDHAIRIGPELRIGGRSPRVFAYGLARVGLELLLGPSFTTGSRPVIPWVMAMLGGGAQGLIGRRFLLGGEGGIDHGGASFVLLRLRILVGVRF